MARGGFRPGAGRPKGAKDKKPRTNASKKPAKKPKAKKPKTKKPKTESPETVKLRKMLEFDKKAKVQFYQEFLVRVSRGETLSIAEKKMMTNLASELAEDLTEDEQVKAISENLTPLEFMLKYMNDPTKDHEYRARLAGMAAPYIHPRAGATGKKEDIAEQAKKVGEGIFSANRPPLKAIK